MTEITKSGRAIRRRVAKGESNPAPLFPDYNFFSKIVKVDKSIKCRRIFYLPPYYTRVRAKYWQGFI
jgi:hypothetical protein